MQGLPDINDQLQGLGIVDASPAPVVSSIQHAVPNAINPPASYRGPPPGYQPANHLGLDQPSGQALLDALRKGQMGQSQQQIDTQAMQWPPQSMGVWPAPQGTPFPPADRQGWPLNGPSGAMPPGYAQPWGHSQAPPPPMRGPPPGFDLQQHPYPQQQQQQQPYPRQPQYPTQQQFPAPHPQQLHPPQQQQPPVQLGSLFGTPLQGTVGTPPRRGPPPGFGPPPPAQPSPVPARPVDAPRGAAAPPARPADLGQSPANRPTRGSKPTDRSGPANTASSVFREFRNRNRRNMVLQQPPVCDMELLSTQLQALTSSLAAPAQETQAQQRAFHGVRAIVQRRWPHARLELFGSAANGLSIGCNNDIDVCLVLDETDATHEHKVETVEALGPLLEEAGMQEVLVLGRARVPVVKFVFPDTETKVDITINNLLACYNTRLIAEYCNVDDRLRQLIMLVKHWAKRRNVAEAYKGCLSSYCYVLMCIYCCQQQQPPVVPNLQREQPPVVNTHVGEWKVAFSAASHFPDFGKRNKEGLAYLLLSFFDYWTWKHDYQQDVASIRIGGRLSKQQKGWTLRVGTERHLICIEDPFQLDHDLGRNVDRHTLETMLHEFERADELLHAQATPLEALFEQWQANEPQE